MRPAAATSLDVAIWFLDRARAEDTYIQPRKLQSLLFLAQAHYAAAAQGRRLMPSVFVFDEGGAMDPNVYRAFQHGRPDFTMTPLPDSVTAFLDAIWRRYRTADALRLDQVIASHGKTEPAIRRRDGAEVTLAAMRRMFGADVGAGAPAEGGRRKAAPSEADADELRPPVANQPKVMRLHTGRKVTVKKWMPAKKVVQR